MVKGLQDGNTYWINREGAPGGLEPNDFGDCEKPECHWRSYVKDLVREARNHNPILGKWTGDIKEAKTVTIEDDGHF